MKPIFHLNILSVFLLATLLALTACETRAPRPDIVRTEPVATVGAAEKAEQGGEYVLAAREYEGLAKLATPPQRQHYELKAVESLIKAGQAREARERLRVVDVTKLDAPLQARKRIHEAQLAALEGRPDEALRLLTQAEKTPNLNPALLAEVYRVRAQAGPNRSEGVGVAEAPRGTLIHHYRIDEHGLVTWANLIIATGHNNLAMNQGILQTAKRFVDGSRLREGMLNRVEAVIRTFDPCLSCATHALGKMPLEVRLLSPEGKVLDVRRR